MKKEIIVFFIFLLFTSCKSLLDISQYNGYKKEIYNFNNMDIKYSVRIFVPKNYLPTIRLGGDIESFHYIDSSLIYIGEHSRATYNYDNIKESVDSIRFNIRFEGVELKYQLAKELGLEIKKPDTIILEGIDSLGRFWKDIRVDYLCYGYKSVPKKRKKIFDKALLSIDITKLIESNGNIK